MIEVGDKVTTQAHEHLALDYHGLQGVVGDKKKERSYSRGYRQKDIVLCWVDFCGPEYEKRNSEHQGARRLVKGLWIPEDALTKTHVWPKSLENLP